MAETVTEPGSSTDPQDFGAVVRRYSGPVLASALRQLGDRQLAEDATQAVFLAFHQSKERVASEGHLAGFLFQSTRYVCQNIRRTRGRQERRDMNYARKQCRTESEMDAEIAVALDDAIASLEKVDRELVLRRYFEGRSSVVLAESMKVPEATVRKRLSRAVERLRDHLAQTGVVTGTGAVASVLAMVLPGGGVWSEAVAQTLLIAAGSAETAAGTGAGTAAGQSGAGVASAGGVTGGVKSAAIFGGSKMLAASLASISAAALVAVGVIAMTSDGSGSAPASMPPGNPGRFVTATPPGRGVAVTVQEKTAAEVKANAGDYAGAMMAYAEELSAIDPSAYRDKKTFNWIRDVAATRKDSLGTLRAAAESLLEKADRDKAMTDWRTHRFLAGLAQSEGDSAIRKKELQLTIDTYPAIRYSEPSKFSSLQHLYNEMGEILAEEKGFDAGTAYLLEQFAKDDRFVYVFLPPWEELAKKSGETAKLKALASKLEAAYDSKAKRVPAVRQQVDEYRRQLKAEAIP